MKKGPFKSKKTVLTYLGGILGALAILMLPANQEAETYKSSFFALSGGTEVELGDFPVVVPTYKYGFVMEAYQVEENTVKPNQTLGTLLSGNGLGATDLQKLVDNSKGVFNVNSHFRVNTPYLLLKDRKSGEPKHLVYQPNIYEYIVFDLSGHFEVKRIEKPTEIRLASATGEITSSLWQTLTKQGISFEAAAKMEDALQWSVDFSHTQKGDVFKMIYDKKLIEGEEVGVGQVHAAYYNRQGKEHFAIWFDDSNGNKGYFDREGRAAAAGFLKAPVKYTRISSNFSPQRFHPILKRVRPHFGTDYAAPHGTPIYAVGSGVVTEAAYNDGNGRYVKIKHDKVYQTQYLHMSKFAKGIRPGVQVTQGEVIGYVGSTGLATGPHVCFRFWKNGVQVDHLKENLPSSVPLPNDVLPMFFEKRDSLLKKLGELNISEQNPAEVDCDKEVSP